MSAVLADVQDAAAQRVAQGEALVDRFWHIDDDNQATREGWNVFVGPFGPEIQPMSRVKPTIFDSHAAAHAHVYMQAIAGSPLHQRALMLTLLSAPGIAQAAEVLLRDRVPEIAPRAMPRVVIEVEGTVKRVTAPVELPLTLVEYGRPPVADEPEFRPQIDDQRAYVSDSRSEVAPERLDMVRACQADAEYENAPPGMCV